MTLVMTVVMKVILLDGVGGRREAHRIRSVSFLNNSYE